MFTQSEKNTLIKITSADPFLSPEEKISIKRKLNQEPVDTSSGVVNGVIGATAALAIANFLKLSKQSQILVTLAGYGVGKYLLDNSNKHDRLIEFNNKTNSYKLNV